MQLHLRQQIFPPQRLAQGKDFAIILSLTVEPEMTAVLMQLGHPGTGGHRLREVLQPLRITQAAIETPLALQHQMLGLLEIFFSRFTAPACASSAA